jgi:hypothetical protein
MNMLGSSYWALYTGLHIPSRIYWPYDIEINMLSHSY